MYVKVTKSIKNNSRKDWECCFLITVFVKNKIQYI